MSIQSLSPNPYQAPETENSPKGHARFRLRRWFAATLYLTLLIDFLSVWILGFQPFLLSLSTFTLVLAASVLKRADAVIRLHDSGIEYRDLVQAVDVSWDRVVGVIHRESKTSLSTNSTLAQITVVRSHEDYDAIVSRIAEVQPEFHFEVLDFRDAVAEG